MKVFVLGGTSSTDPDQAKTLAAFCQKLGVSLGNSDHRVIACSCQPLSADRAVLEGLGRSARRSVEGKLIVHRPDDSELRKQWLTLNTELGLLGTVYHDHRGPQFRTEKGLDMDALLFAFLLCQIKAVQESDVVVTVGGAANRSASLALAMAREQKSMILPYRFLYGAAEQAFLHLEERLRTRLSGDDIDKLSDPEAGADAAFELIDKLGSPRVAAAPRVFLSYPWKRSEGADLVEAFLRRHDQVTVFRDERDILQGESITARIQDEIENKCDMFVALWGREYVESPYCYDEMDLWMKHRHGENLFLLLFDDTRPVWPWLRQTFDNREAFVGNWPRVGTDRRVVEAAIGKFLTTYETRIATHVKKP